MLTVALASLQVGPFQPSQGLKSAAVTLPPSSWALNRRLTR
jgi:hypothetical protein